MQLIVRTDAEADVAAAYRWYEKQRKGLGSGFLLEVSRAIEAIEERPDQFPLVYGSLHRALVRRFPYGIFFANRATTIVVVAVMHLARNPRRLRTRARD